MKIFIKTLLLCLIFVSCKEDKQVAYSKTAVNKVDLMTAEIKSCSFTSGKSRENSLCYAAAKCGTLHSVFNFSEEEAGAYIEFFKKEYNELEVVYYTYLLNESAESTVQLAQILIRNEYGFREKLSLNEKELYSKLDKGTYVVNESNEDMSKYIAFFLSQKEIDELKKGLH